MDLKLDSRVLDAETAIIGSLCIEPQICGEVMQRLHPDDFIGAARRHVFEAAQSVYLDCRPVDAVTICAAAGAEYENLIREAMAHTPTAANWRAYADVLLEYSRLYRLQAAAMAVLNSSDLAEAKAAMSSAEMLLMDNRGKRKVSFAQGLMEFVDRQADRNPPNYLPWGVRTLDEHIYAEHGDLIILAGEPSTGKTLLAAQFAYTMALKKRRVCLYTLETSDRKLYDRMFSGIGKLPWDKIKRRTLETDQLRQLTADIGYLADKICLDITLAAGFSVADIQADALANHYDVIFIDYLQLISGPGDDGSYERVTSTSIGLHVMAQRTGITVVALSQLSRPDKKQQGRKRVRMSDLRSSGQIEQDADIIMALTLEVPDDKKGNRHLDIIKNKDGEADGFVRFAFDPVNLALRPLTSRRPSEFEPKFKPVDSQEELPFVTKDANNPEREIANADR